jgi:chromosome partitioning protein
MNLGNSSDQDDVSKERETKPEEVQSHFIQADRASSFSESMSQEGTNPAKPQTGPTVIAIANQKGGVAKTTTVVSLGGALARHNQEVLLVDLDAQANLTLALGKDPNRVRGAVTEVLFNSASLLSVSRETSIPGLDLVPANAGMDLAERFLPVRKDYETILRRALRSELHSAPKPSSGSPAATMAYSPGTSPRPPSIHYDFVLLDCPPFLGAVTLNALVAADMLIIPTQPEFFSANALRTMTAAIRQVRGQHNPDLIYRILITIFDRRNRIHREVGEQIRNTFGDGVFHTVIEIDTKLRESAIEGLPITHRKGQSRSALQYDALAQELMAYV